MGKLFINVAQDKSYRSLISAVVIQALQDYQDEFRKLGFAAEMTEPGRWLLEDHIEPYSFCWCCSVLDLAPDGIRSRINTRGLLNEMRKMREKQSAYRRKQLERAYER